MVRSCWKPSVDGDDGDHGSGSESGRVDGLLWYKDLGNHLYGEFSMAVVQANSSLEDRSELESGPLSSNHFGPQGTFIGVYDGHGGAEASQFVSDNLFFNLKRLAGEHQGISEKVISKAFSATEAGFLSLVKKQWLSKPHIASTGTCCLVGIICNGMLYVANSGDSRVVLGRVERATRETSAVQLSTEHNVNQETIRDELQSKHPYDPQIVVMRHNVWRVKGLIQVSRSIGDAYLKKAEFNREPLPSKYRLAETFFKPILSSEPSISSHKLHPDDQFLIFASDGLWEHLSNQEAVNIVTNNSPNGIARRLVKAALREAARKREMRFADLQKIEQGVRRHFHDDITVIVVFLNHKFTDHSSLWGSPLSIKGGGSANY
ncbi:probable protein phosphatase 2C 38 [Lotus japonicus]|uniref:probable protein phosphatase 2C 38 n=1 Tax=Lotus japonicus TaxID=34305 RepID=UPI002586D442|nr:probable protein phosphatase 2C 38 [Lotus japonicus]XP_057427029.1 probable protein phosphatase 2C 38 [Lotus japonicus]